MQPAIAMTTAASVQIHHLTGSPERAHIPLPSLHQEDGNAITPTPEDLTPNE